MRRISIIVKPNARKDAVLGERDGALIVAVAAPPEDGKANTAIERFLTKRFNTQARIVSGFTGKRKTVLLEDA